jgi:hypothetical protein
MSDTQTDRTPTQAGTPVAMLEQTLTDFRQEAQRIGGPHADQVRVVVNAVDQADQVSGQAAPLGDEVAAIDDQAARTGCFLYRAQQARVLLSRVQFRDVSAHIAQARSERFVSSVSRNSLVDQ